MYSSEALKTGVIGKRKKKKKIYVNGMDTLSGIVMCKTPLPPNTALEPLWPSSVLIFLCILA